MGSSVRNTEVIIILYHRNSSTGECNKSVQRKFVAWLIDSGISFLNLHFQFGQKVTTHYSLVDSPACTCIVRMCITLTPHLVRANGLEAEKFFWIQPERVFSFFLSADSIVIYIWTQSKRRICMTLQIFRALHWFVCTVDGYGWFEDIHTWAAVTQFTPKSLEPRTRRTRETEMILGECVILMFVLSESDWWQFKSNANSIRSSFDFLRN